ncbi:hypothetical protein OPV22_005080 [Ensete ventricosum]|uniref:Uncharacterized protein n=1 Tax=Ensete ventricosum TaxID=4639 RepID=A0AAV8RLF9_ENSVE|nr:hypothetical protein OPV22_005080 [Ensete ventricosum]
MDRAKRRTKASSSTGAATEDELATTKAAAWAWYQRGSGSDGRGVGEFDLGGRGGAASAAGAGRKQRPSRYKLEALAASEEKPRPVPLLDVYDIERITRELERLVVASDGGGRQREVAFATATTREGRKAASGSRARPWICGATAADVAALPARGRGKAATTALHRSGRPRAGKRS